MSSPTRRAIAIHLLVLAVACAPDLRAYAQSDTAAHIALEHAARPSPQTSDKSYHYLVVHVDGTHFRVEVVGVDAGPGFHPNGSHVADLSDLE